jgi:hypothetical protein
MRKFLKATELITTSDTFGIESHYAPSALGLFWGDGPGALPQAFTFRAFGALALALPASRIDFKQ